MNEIKKMLTLKDGKTALLLHIKPENSYIRVIGKPTDPKFNVYIISQENGKNEYITVGQAHQKNIYFSSKNNIIGAAMGIYGSDAFFEEYIEEKNSSLSHTPHINKENKTIPTLSEPETQTKHSQLYQQYLEEKASPAAQDTFKNILQKFRKEMDELEKAGVFDKQEIQDIIREPKEEKIKPVCHTLSDIDYMFEYNQKLTPFKSDEYHWIRICLDELWLLNDKKENIINPFVMSCEMKYGHIMAGRNSDGEILIAVPEKFSREDIKVAHKYGFNDFYISSLDKDNEPFGYWIKHTI